VLEIIVQGRGGQGAQTAGNLLAAAFFAEGRHVQAFASYGGARRGTPVSSFIRIDNRPIRLRCDIERASAILCFDATLLDERLLAKAGEDTIIVVNSSREPEHFAAALPAYRVTPVDGIAISRRHGLGRIVNSALLGALARAIGAPTLATLQQTIQSEVPKLHAENIAACEDGYRVGAQCAQVGMRAERGPVSAGDARGATRAV
jgi:2-oxoacid:acceptor oxidoreductase gamma subunit (pyruvate/2-ketoisovalerate family)